MMRFARRRGCGDKDLLGLPRRRRASIDNHCFDLAVETRRPRAVLRYARRPEPRHVRNRLRSAAGRPWGRCVRSVAAVLARATR